MRPHCQGKMTCTEQPSGRFDSLVPFTDELRLAVAARRGDRTEHGQHVRRGLPGRSRAPACRRLGQDVPAVGVAAFANGAALIRLLVAEVVVRVAL